MASPAMRVWGASWVGVLWAAMPPEALACPGCAPVGAADAGPTLLVLGALGALPVGLLALGALGLCRAMRHEDRGEVSHPAASLE